MDRPVFSDMLAERRRQLGFSTRQAARVLRLREDVLVAFEEGDFERMPKSGYAQGMLSSYARYLGLDAVSVVEAYARDHEEYRHEIEREQRMGRNSGSRARASRGGSGGGQSAQPHVGRRGLLPTSGGPAGDMGTFSTTRVRTRGTAEQTERDAYAEYPQGRPYTGRSSLTTRRSRSMRSTRTYDDISTMRLDDYEYGDDLRLRNEAERFESASSNRGRRGSRNITKATRPRVSRSGARGQSRRRDASRRSSGRDGGSRSRRNGSNLMLLGIVGVALLLVVVIVVSVGSCVRQGSEVRTVPVTTAAENDASTGTSGAGDATTGDGVDTLDQGLTDDPDASPGADPADQTSRERETSVSVKVDEGAVTWLEVTCDDKSDVAETITGPWQRTYTVTDAITIQAGDTTAVTVVQNGRQVQFDSMASGLGTMRIQGSGGQSTKNRDKDSAEDAGSDANSASAKTGNATSAEYGTDSTQGNTDSDNMGSWDTTYGDSTDASVTSSEYGSGGGYTGYDGYGYDY